MTKYLVVGNGGANGAWTATSTDGLNWSTNRVPAFFEFNSVTYGNGIWLASARPQGVGFPNLYRSGDGINWTLANGADVSDGLNFGDGTFVAYGLKSTDAITWTSTGSSYVPLAVGYGNSIWLLSATDTTNTIAYSNNLSTWNTATNGIPAVDGVTNQYAIRSFAYKPGGVHLGVGDRVAGTTPTGWAIRSTTGGSSWTATQILAWQRAYSVTWDGSQFVAIGTISTGALQVASSPDGITWTLRNTFALPSAGGFGSSTNTAASNIVYASGRYVISGFIQVAGSATGAIATSTDLTSWTQVNLNWSVSTVAWGLFHDQPIPDDAPQDAGVGMVDQYTSISATLSYDAPATTGNDALTLYRVTKDFRFGGTGQAFPIPPRSQDGLPYYQNAFDPANPAVVFTTQPGQLPYTDEIVEPWGKIAVLINNEDVTFFRGAAAVVENVAWQSFGNFETASIFLPTVTVYDNLGVSRPTLTSGTAGGLLPGALSWLYDSAPVEIKRILPNGDQATLWLGTINNLQVESNGVGMRISAHGLIYDANHQILPGPFNENTVSRATPQDVGLLTADVLNSIEGRWSYAEPKVVGVDTIKVPNWDNALEFLRNLSALGSPELWIDENGKPYVNGRPGTGTRQSTTIDVIAGQEGLELELAHDGTAPATVIYGSGSLPGGTQWRNVVYAYPSPSNPSYEALRWPFDDPNTLMILGMKNADTITNFGVTSLCNRLIALGRLTRTYTVYNRTIETAVKNLQDDWGFDDTGKVDYKFWSRLIGVADVTQGAHIEPLYVSPLVDPTSPSYDPTVRRVETHIDFGSDITVDEAKVVAEQIAMRDMIQYNTTGTPIYKQNKSITGTVGMTLCPVGYSNPATTNLARWDIKPGDSLRIWGHVLAPIPADTHTSPVGTTWEGGDSAGSVLLYIKRVEWDLGGTPKAILTVSSRDLEYSELDAAQERVRVSNAEEALVKKVKKTKKKK